MALIAMILGIVAASGSLAWGYHLGGFDDLAFILALTGVVWLVFELRGWLRIGSLALLVYIATAAWGLWMGLPSSLMVVGAVAGLLAWDLSGFMRRMKRASPHDDLRGMEARHLARVSIVAAISLVIAGVAAFVRVRLPFEVAVGLVILGALGLTRLVLWIQRENDL